VGAPLTPVPGWTGSAPTAWYCVTVMLVRPPLSEPGLTSKTATPYPVDVSHRADQTASSTVSAAARA